MNAATPALSLDSLILECEAALPGWVWLVRNDEEHGAFANVLLSNGPGQMPRASFPIYAPLAVDALRTSLAQARIWQSKHA